MHPAVLAGGIGALDVALTGQAALYARHRDARDEARRGRRKAVPAPTYRRPARRPEAQEQLKGGAGEDEPTQ